MYLFLFLHGLIICVHRVMILLETGHSTSPVIRLGLDQGVRGIEREVDSNKVLVL